MPSDRQAQSAIAHSGRFSERIATRSPRANAELLEAEREPPHALEHRRVRDRLVPAVTLHLVGVVAVELLERLEEELDQRAVHVISMGA